MASMKPVIILFLCLYSLTIAISSKSIDSRGVPSDVKYIKCETCAQIAKAAAEKATELDSNKVSELSMFDLVESICDPKSANGRWMRTIDLVERLGKLKLIPQDGVQDCTRECRTMALACNAIMEGYETELGEKLYALRKVGDIDASAVESWLCEKKKGVSGACNAKPPLLPRDREKGPAFEKKDPKQVEMDNLMEQMRGMNGGNDFNMNMFSKDQFNAGMDDDDDDDDDEDDEDAEVWEEGEGTNDLGETSLGDASMGGEEDLGTFDVGADLSRKAGMQAGSDEL